MKRKLVFVTILALSLVAIVAVAAVIPALAFGKKNTNANVMYSDEAGVAVELPPPGGAIAGHPTNLALSPYDYGRSPNGAPGADVLVIYIWVSAMNNYIPIAVINDQPPTAEIKAVWNGTPVYLEVNGVVIRNNIKTVADKELDIWTDTTWTRDGWGGCGCGYYTKSEAFIANLTVPVGPLDYTGLPPIFGSTWTVPAMTLTFRPIAEGYHSEETAVLPSGITIKSTYTSVPAWVRTSIPAWLNMGPADVGTIRKGVVTTFTPP
jgi:hypothetical protein